MKGTIEKYEGYNAHFVALDSKTVKRVTKNGNKRVVCRFNNSEPQHYAITNSKTMGPHIGISNALCKLLKLKAGDSVTLSIEIDTSPFQFHVCEEFTEVLSTDSLANAIFEKLTPGNKRSLIQLINAKKNSQQRIEKALLLMEGLKRGITSGPHMYNYINTPHQ